MRSNGGKRRVPTWLVLGVGTVAAGAVAWASGQRGWAAVLAAGGVALTLAGYLADRRDAQAADIDLATVADRLADLVMDQWAAEATRREITQPPLAVSWQPVDPSLVQPWPYLEQLAEAGAGWPVPVHPAAGPHELAGTGGELLDVFDRIPTGRLIVLGEPGSGKTALLIRLVLDLLARRDPGDPVPLLVPLASWDPDRHDLYSWLETQIVRQYPSGLAGTTATGVSRARALLSAGRILPVLDGLDEVRTGGRSQALTAINTTLRNDTHLVLSCRATAFRHAIRPSPTRQPVFVEGAAGIRLDPLTPTIIADYLTTTVEPGGQARWAPIRTALATTPAPPAAQALSTPLMASLARTIYNPRPGESSLGLPNPADLCNTTALPTRTAVEQHLFDGLIPAAYRTHPIRPSRWTADQATPYLTFLAKHLEDRLHTTSLAWWELDLATPPAFRILVVGLPIGLVAGLPAGLPFGLVFGLPVGLPVGLAVGLAFGLAGGLGHQSPHQIVLQRPRLADLAFGLAFGLASGLAFGLAVGLAFGLVVGLVVGLAFGLAGGLGLNTSADMQRAADPRSVLLQDRYSAVAFGLAFGLAGGLAGGLAFGLAGGLAGGLVVGLAGGLVVGLAFGLVGGLAAGLAWGLVVGLDTAWGRLGLARLWLASHNRLPVHLIGFLLDASERGVLRQAGAVWEFRHANLQRRLANRP